ncbi:MAG: WGR domain-containing protein [Antarcticimicrobium sp.]|uniref:WGR domain-containing protein n=1 Tax=Antarcticimicrobium sp. TaxID=2824147 RepID=UPI0026335D79|nr:WGR domain-containing protein [Antarcticimicrobium sp.]MDF1718555.1 WGR domain-containing protein [Antarcticimicrobium sp.]
MIRHFERHVPEDNIARFYRLEVLPTLFGDWAVQRTWGRIGTFGRIRSERFASLDAARAAARTLAKARRRRGYVRLTGK